MTIVVVAPERVKKLQNQYPWLYADEIAEIRGDAHAGELVEIRDARGDFIARAFFSPTSHIAARIITYDASEKINRAFFERRFEQALARRVHAIVNTNALRLVHGEADQLPGLVVDRFADTLVVQFRNAGVENFRKEILQALKKIFPAQGAYERSDTQARREEGLELRVGVLYGDVPNEISIFEDDVEFFVNPLAGQKTGFYLDQRDNRRLLRTMVMGSDAAQPSRVLDVFSYTGAFSLHAAKAGAHALAVDKDQVALQQLEANARRNNLSERVGARWGDAEKVLAQLVQERRSFSHIVLDPPTLAKHKNEVPPAKQLFTRLTTDALRLLEPNGILFLSTCAYHISVNDLIEVSRIAAGDVSRRASVITVTYQPADHPWILQIPETLYLKTLVLRVE
ncbi:MAG: class I SAM-dependent rRNA methyltransferase [Chloroflexota bacterium]|nr:MAG: class I SAM-dependent rRNA methyltransferase [Chloroflexota bacterium]